MNCFQCLFLFVVWLSLQVSCYADEVQTIVGNGIEKINLVSPCAATEPISQPYGLAVGPDNCLYFCDIGSHVVRRLNASTGQVEIVAGTGKQGYSGNDDAPTHADLNEPYEVAFDSHGDLYFVEMKNHVVRKIDRQTNTIQVVAGCGEQGFAGDKGPATEARLNQPHSIAFDSDDRLYICDIGNHRVRVVDPETKRIDTYAGTGLRAATIDGAAVDEIHLNGPRAIARYGNDRMILALREGNALYEIDLRRRTIHHLAGSGASGFDPQELNSKSARLSGPKGVAVSASGDVYFADTESHTIRMYRRSTATVSCLIGTGQPGDGPDGDPLSCQLRRPHGVCLDGDGRLYIGDSENFRVRLWVP